MKEKVAVATVEGKAYFLIINALREQRIPFLSVVPGEPVPSQVKVVITTPQESSLVSHEKTLIFHDETELNSLIGEAKRILLGKEAYDEIVVGVDPGEAIGLAIIADGKVIDEDNCFSTSDLVKSIAKAMADIDFSLTSVRVKIGDGVPVYREIVEGLDSELPPQVELEVVGEEGTNKPLKEKGHTRKIRHISSAIRIAARTGYVVPRGGAVAANS